MRVLVGYAPGGGTDIMARAVSLKLSESLGHQFVVDNRPGGNANLAAELAARAAPDGYTVLIGSGSPMAAPAPCRNVRRGKARLVMITAPSFSSGTACCRPRQG